MRGNLSSFARLDSRGRLSPHRCCVVKVLCVLVSGKTPTSRAKGAREMGHAVIERGIMTVLISMLRGVNVGGHNKVKMDALRALYESLKCEGARTYVQSGNVIFRTNEKNAAALAKKIQDGIEKEFGFRPALILRTKEELRKAIAANPFAGRKEVEPGKLLVTFLEGDPGAGAQATLRALEAAHPEELHLLGRELYIYFPNGAGKTKLPWSSVERLLKTQGTARNWNSVTKMLEIAEELEGGK